MIRVSDGLREAIALIRQWKSGMGDGPSNTANNYWAWQVWEARREVYTGLLAELQERLDRAEREEKACV